MHIFVRCLFENTGSVSGSRSLLEQICFLLVDLELEEEEEDDRDSSNIFLMPSRPLIWFVLLHQFYSAQALNQASLLNK